MREQRELLTLLGLKRRAKRVQSLAEISAELVQQEQRPEGEAATSGAAP